MAINRRYVSEADEFIAGLLKQKPELKQKQKELRSTWWDKDFVDLGEQKTYSESSAPKHGYAYFDYSADVKKD